MTKLEFTYCRDQKKKKIEAKNLLTWEELVFENSYEKKIKLFVKNQTDCQEIDGLLTNYEILWGKNNFKK